MKLCVSSYSFQAWRRQNKKTLEDSINAAAGLGLKAIELSGMADSKHKKVTDPLELAKRLRQTAQKKGMVIPGYCVGGELLLPPKKLKAEIAKRKSEVDIAVALGAASIRQDVTRGFPKEHKGTSTFTAALKILAPALREVADYAQEKGVVSTLENHGFYLQESARVKKLLDAVDHPNYRFTMDMGNFLCMNENPLLAVERLVDYAVMIHAKDFHVRPKKMMPPSGWFATPTPIALRGAIVGHGEIDIPAQLKILKKAKYKGYLSLEFEGMEEPLNAVRLGLEYLSQQLQALNLLEK